ncbi:glycoside hydrolase family 43 protein [Peniophora sp. CONT]|nr:glycoside hydrolase family 43 protein [Peniophora sp. CONT]
MRYLSVSLVRNNDRGECSIKLALAQTVTHPSSAAMLFFASVGALALSTLAWAYPNPGAVSGDTNVADPTLCKDSAGTYFLFSTAPGIQIRTSTDRTNWKLVGTVWTVGKEPAGTVSFTGDASANLWAPDCTYKDGEFYLYYAASTFGTQNSGIFFAKSKTGLPGSWTDMGLVTSTKSGDNFNAIDPNLLIDGSTWRMSLGSFFGGIKGVTLSSSTGKLASSSVTSLAQRGGSDAIEGSVVFKSGSYYYLFASWDKCCDGLSSTYSIHVGRSKSATGPFVDKAGVSLTNGGGTVVLETHGSIVGPGGQDLMTDNDGVVIVYHYYTSTASKLGINLVDFSSGWPVLK